MVTALTNALVKWDKLAGVECVLLSTGLVFHVVVLEKKKSAIRIVQQKDNIGSFEELIGFVGVDVPIALVLSGKGILHKSLGDTAEVETQRLFAQVVPNASLNDFYIQHFQNQAGNWLSIVRKSVINELLKPFEQQKIPMLSLSLGGLVLHSILPLLGENASLQLGSHAFGFLRGEIVQYSYSVELANAFTLQLATETVPSELVVAFGAAFQHYLPSQLIVEIPTLAEAKEDYRLGRLFTVLGWGMLLFFLTVLLGNYIAFSSLSQENDRLVLAASLYKTQTAQIKMLQKEVVEKEAFLHKTGWAQAPKLSFYADRIAATLPASVMLQTLSLSPLDERKTRDTRKQVYDADLIRITGSCNQPIDLNGWIKRLKDLPWAREVKVENYTYDSGERQGNFKVEIHL